ncbi:MAG: DUF3568 family protein [Candidatus Omnitrophota bacterium]
MKKSVALLFCAVFLISVAGCATAMLGGKSGTRFQASLDSVSQAAFDTLEAEDLPVVKRSTSAEMVKIYSKYPNGTPIRIIMRSITPGYTDTNIGVGTFGEDYRAYDLMKKIESRIKK